MFFPIADTPNPPGRPLVNWLLIGINVGVYLLVSLPATMRQVSLNDPILLDYLRALGLQGQVSAREVLQQVSAYDLLVFQYGFRPAEFAPLTLLSSLFLHGGLMHLAGNMLFLWIFGDNVEYRLGSWRYLLAYLGTGVIATLFFAMFVPGSQVPLIGASGAISGVLGCYFLWFPRNKVRCFLFFFPFLMTSIYLSARLVLGAYLLIDNLLPFLLVGSSGSGVAHGAHIGGFLGGLTLAWMSDRYPGLLYHPGSSAEKKRPSRPGDLHSLQDLCPALARGDLDGAASCFLSLESREQRSQVEGGDILRVAEHLFQSGDYPAALQVYRRYIAERPNDSRIDQAFLGAGKSMLEQPRYWTSAYHYFLSALDQAGSPQLAEEATRYLRMIERQKKQAMQE